MDAKLRQCPSVRGSRADQRAKTAAIATESKLPIVPISARALAAPEGAAAADPPDGPAEPDETLTSVPAEPETMGWKAEAVPEGEVTWVVVTFCEVST